MNRALAAMVLVLAFATAASANWYLYSDGYYYYGNGSQAYTRSSYYNAGYWSCGRYYPGYYSYSYTPYYAPATYTAPVVADFDTQLLGIAKLKVQEDAKIAKLRAVGVTLTKDELFRFQGQAGGYAGPYSAYGHAYQTFTPVVSTLTVNSQAALYGDTNMNQLYLIQGQLVKQVGALFSESNSLFASNVQTAGNNAARVAEINAKAAAHIAFAQALQVTPVVETRGIKFSITPGKYPTVDSSAATPQTKQGIGKAWLTAAQSCIPCHLNPNRKEYADIYFKGIAPDELKKYPKGGFDLDDYPAMSQADREKIVYPRIDPLAPENKRMPRKADGTAGTPLTAQELGIWQMVDAGSFQANPGASAGAEPIRETPLIDKNGK